MELTSVKYGVSKTFDLPLIEYGATDFKTGVSLATGDVKISKDGGAFTNIATLPTINGAWMEIVLSATEMQANRIKVQIIDQTATKVFEDTGAILNTDILDLIWDEPLTGATHNVPASSGRRLRAIGDVVSGAVDDVSATVNSFITDLTGSQTDHYADQTLLFVSGNLAGMSRSILSYNSSTKLVTIEEDLPEAPADGDDFDINPVHIHPVSQVVQEVWDRILTSSNHNITNSAGKILRELKEVAGYEGGFIYYDSVGGAAGDEPFVNGTLENPVNNETDLNTLIAALNFGSIKILSGSTLTLTASAEKRVYTGEIWTLALGGQSISATTFHGANVSGIGTGAVEPKFEHSHLGNVTLPPSHLDTCALGGEITIGSVGAFFLADNCHSGVAGPSGAPSVDFGAAIGDTQFNMRNYSGGVELKNMGQNGADTVSIEGDGQVIFNANSIGGIVAIRGHQTITGDEAFIAAGGTIDDDARFDINQIPNVTPVIVVAGGGTPSPAYADETEPSKMVQGDVVGIVRYLVGDFSSNRIFFGAKTATGDTSYVVGLIECNNITYDAETGFTSYTIPLVADDTKLVNPGIYKAETEVRDADGVNDPVTGDRYDFEISGEIIT